LLSPVGLTSVAFPAGLIAIGDYDFYGCSVLSSVTLPASLASIGNYAFAGCGGLTSVRLQATTPPTLGANAFAGVASGCTFDCPEGYRDGYSASDWAPYFPIIEDEPEPEPEPVDPTYDFKFTVNNGMAIVTGMSDGVTVTALTLPATVIYEGTDYPVTAIDASAFYGCVGLTSVTLPASLTSIGASAFYDCSGLTSVTLPASLDSIGEYAFYGCSGLTADTLQSAMPPTLGEGAFAGVPDACTFACPKGTRRAY
jgi:hypothetical protein